MKKYTTIKEEEFNAIKGLQAAGVTSSQSAKALKRSSGTLSRIYRAKDWESYRADLADHVAKYGKKKTPRVTEEQSTVTESPAPSISSNLQDIYNENLGIIAEKMDKNTEALEKMTIALYSLRKSMGVPTGEGNKRWIFGSPFKEKA